MGKLALISRVGPTDKGIKVDKGAYLKTGQLFFNYNFDSTDVSIESFLKELKRLKSEPSEVMMDLLVIACSMYGADTRISRAEYAEDSWTRQIDLYIPVSNPTIWNAQTSLLERIFKFLTGDIWKLYFRTRKDPKLKLSPIGHRKEYKMPYQTNTVCLFSGGLDSFMGAINLLENGVRPLLVGHAKSADVSPNQKACEQALSKAYPESVPKRVYAFVRVPKSGLFNSEDHNERGRSFLFLSLGAITASSLNENSRLVVPENGLISLNVPLTPLRHGAHSTRTTHPYYFGLMQELFDGLGIGVKIENPFQFKTKGEMMLECKNKKLISKTNTMSCSSPSGRYMGMGNSHCGYCVPCIIRRAAFKKGKQNDRSDYRKDILKAKTVLIDRAEGEDILAFKYMIQKSKQNKNYIKSAIRITGPLGVDVDRYVDVYQRGIKEVETLLKSVRLR